MKRRTFVQKTAILSSSALLLNPFDMVASQTSSCQLDLTSILSQGKKIIISGSAIDAASKKSVNANIEVKTGYGLFSKTRISQIDNGSYSIIGSVLHEGLKKIKVKIEAQGYKTFDGYIYVSNLGSRIHSDMWQYNPNFKPEFIPKNRISDNLIDSTFNFYLVKA